MENLKLHLGSPKLTPDTRRPKPMFWAAIVWIAITVVCAAMAVAKPRSHTVYPIFTCAAGEWIAGRDIYVEVPGFDFFRYSPSVAAFFAPWRLLGDAWGGAIWRVIGVGLLVGGLGSWSRQVFNQRKPMEQLSWLLLLVAPFALQNVHNGQSNPHVLGLLLLGTGDVINGRIGIAAIWFVAAALFKPYVLAIAALVAIIDSRLWTRLAVALLVGLAVPFLNQSPSYVSEQYAEWVRHLVGNDRSGMELRAAYRDVALLFRVYLVQLPPLVYLMGTATVGLAMAVLVWRGKKSDRSRVEQIGCAFALGSCWVTVLGPSTESCTYLLLTPSLATAVLMRAGQSGQWVRVSYALFVGTIAASLFPQDWRIQALGPQPIAGLILLAVVVAEAIRRMQQVSGIEVQPVSLAA